MTRHLTTPDHSVTTSPKGIPYIISNECAERFSFYGMKGILVIFMTRYLLDRTGNQVDVSREDALSIYHLFTAGAYFFPLIGAVIADVFWGKYKTILLISLMYCFGHGMLALMDLGPITGRWDMQPFLYLGLLLVAIGAGGIKPCVSAHVGDQFGNGNKHLITVTFNWFYFSINLGAAASNIITPWLLATVGAWAAFGLPGVLMGLATFVFWLGRNTFIHVPPSGWQKFKSETFSPAGRRALTNLAPLFLIFVPVFWAIFDQTGSAWVLQAESMNREFLGITWLESQVQFVNPVLILILIPFCAYVAYPFMGRFFEPTPLRKVGIGFLFAASTFAVSALLDTAIVRDGPAAAEALLTRVSESLDAPPEGVNVERTQEILILADKEPFRFDTDRSLRQGPWKLVQAEGDQWKLFNLDDDPTELNDLSQQAAVRHKVMSEKWAAMSKTVDENGLTELTLTPETLASTVRMLRDDEAGWKHEFIGQSLQGMPSIGWQFFAYLLLTTGEVMVSIVCLEFAYTQSPPRMKSFIMGVYFLGVALGNFAVSALNFILEKLRDPAGNTPLEGPTYYWFFAGLMVATTVVYVFFAMSYKGQAYIQGDEVEGVAG